METAHPEPILGQMQALGLLIPPELTSTSHCGHPSSPKTLCLLPCAPECPSPWRLAPRRPIYIITLSYTHCLRGKARQRGGLFRQGLFCCMK